MPTMTTSNMFYLGNYADVDTDESDADNENGGILIADHGRPSIVSVDMADEDDDGILYDDEFNLGPDTVSYDAGSGAVLTEFDSTSVYTAEITLGDGSILTENVVVVQTVNGDTFLLDSYDTLDNINIQNIALTSENSSNYAGVGTTGSIENSNIVCFARGTTIETNRGIVPVQTLEVGDLVLTADNGFQPICWIGCGTVQSSGKHSPIEIAAGALGPAMPLSPLLVSPQHRLYIRSRIAHRMFNEIEIVMPALRLVGLPGVEQRRGSSPVQYWHVLTDQHQLILANGAWAETMYPDPQALAALSEQSQRELEVIFGASVAHLINAPPCAKVRYEPTPKRQRRLIERHARNGHPLVEYFQDSAVQMQQIA
jgi:hypothetical protein